MSIIESVRQFTEELNKRNVSFCIIGGLAVFAYGGERTTFDVDFLIHNQDRDKINEIVNKLQLKKINENKEVLQLSGNIQLDVVFANRPTSQEMLARARTIPSFPYPIAAPEDLIGLKIQAFTGDRKREFTDKDDILTLIRNIPDLDYNKIKQYADLFNVWNEIEDIKNRV